MGHKRRVAETILTELEETNMGYCELRISLNTEPPREYSVRIHEDELDSDQPFEDLAFQALKKLIRKMRENG